ncbi:MAG: alpha-ketoacid dehydrogenase subunit beta [Verrucomicrobia bacterium]|nr:MAG: alpha-ketoacid dehydrogenase subunit beta [Verrucomicrobiota bacterium]
MPRKTYRKALNEAIAEEMIRDDRVFMMGEEVGQFQGAYKVSQGLLEQFGPKRIIDTPISENGFAGLGIGAAMLGLRPIVEFMTWSFSYVALDQIINNAANMRYMFGGLCHVPIVFRGPANGGVNVGATHSHTPENFYGNVPGLKVICPATAYDVKGLMKSAIRDNDPVCCLENTILYNLEEEVPDEEYLIPLGKADIKKEGKDITIIAHGRAVITSLAAAEILEEKYNINAEVLDLRSIRPLDQETILKSVRKTNRVLLVEENKPFCGVDAQIAYIIHHEAFDDLDAPIHRVSAIDAPQIYSMPLEKIQLPNPNRVVEEALKVLK